MKIEQKTLNKELQIKMKKLFIVLLIAVSLFTTNYAQSSASLVNPASYTPVNEVAANSIASVFGTNLSVNTVSDDTLPYGTSLGNVEVTIGGTAALLSFVSPGQINLIVPNIGTGSKALVVKRNGSTTHTGTITVTQIVAGFFNYAVVTPTAEVNVGYVDRYNGASYESSRNFYSVSGSNLVIQALESYVSGRTYIGVLFLTGAANSNTNSKVIKMQNDSTATIYTINMDYTGSCFCSPGLDQINFSLSNSGKTGYAVPSGTYTVWAEWTNGGGNPVYTSTNTFKILVP